MIHFLSGRAEDARLAGRTSRSLESVGLSNIQGMFVATPGAWLAPLPTDEGDFSPRITLPKSDGFIGFGFPPGTERDKFLKRCGGDVSSLRWWQMSFRNLPPLVYLSPLATTAFQAAVAQGQAAERVLRKLLRSKEFRVVHLPQLDCHVDWRIRTIQVVTTIQIGGAEKITLDLAAELNRLETPTMVAAMGKPTRGAYAVPANFCDLSTAIDRVESLLVEACRFGADVVHAHLLDAVEVKRIRAAGFPVVVTLHNTPNAWPRGMAELGVGEASLLLGCAQAITREITLPIPSRTLWNGVLPQQSTASEKQLRHELRIPDDAIVLLALANVRLQKRFDRLPEILAAAKQSFHPVETYLILAGQGTDQLPLPKNCHPLGLLSNVSSVLAACDVLISPSDHEGLSLAQLEALAAGKPVVATDVGGAREVPGIHLVPVDASPVEFALAIRTAMESTPPTLPKSFTRHAMARRAQWLYPRLLAPMDRTPNGLLLVCNNFSIGGAQSSARRLLLALSQAGVHVRAAVVEEHPAVPTAGRIALQESGINVFVTPHGKGLDAQDACRVLLNEIDSDPPEVVVFWNLITSYKILLADALLHQRVYDVSPGEMYYTSLHRYFEQPRTGLPYTSPSDYGALLSGMIVKYEREADEARTTMGCPVEVIANGVPVSDARKGRVKSDTLVFATSVRLSPDKRLEELLEAFRLALPKLPKCELRIAGGPDGENHGYAKSLRRFAKGLPVRWCGYTADIPSFLAQADVFVMISEPAGCPNASLEAMASGLPIIATDHGGASQQVVHGENGFLTPRADASALAERMIELAANPTMRSAMGRQSAARIEQHFSMNEMLRRYREVLRI